MERVFNFGAGPCTLPLEVLKEAQSEFTNFQGSGMSIIESSHRGKEYDTVHHEALTMLKELYGAPEDMEVLLLQGGATLQFSMIPMNLAKKGKKAAYLVTGSWSKKALADGKLYADAYAAWDGKDDNYSHMPKSKDIKLQENTQYLYICSNETIGGIRFPKFPDVDVPLIVDVSSEFLSRPIEWDKCDLVYGGVQKNLGPSGVTILFIRKHLLENLNTGLGAYLNYATHAKAKSLYNTPPVFSIYMMNKVLKWVKKCGGLKGIEKMAEEKAGLIYDAMDQSNGYFRSPVAKEDRSRMNIVFRLPTEELEAKFLEESKKKGLVALKGHRSVGGLRASTYNAMPLEGAKALVAFMKDFQAQNPAS
ncbi:MAG: 3-phosphoserine/phosphohydroxythreonine aminotransferase [Acidobacteria bacterium]|nr:MAG: 3-phosphoserine/phosphohydroxythreonine aminotransferase [Acidobacteriota bacterium]